MAVSHTHFDGKMDLGQVILLFKKLGGGNFQPLSSWLILVIPTLLNYLKYDRGPFLGSISSNYVNLRPEN